MLSGVRSRHLLSACLAILPAYLLQDDLIVRLVQVLVFFALAKLAGKRIRIGYFAILTASVTVFELFVPWGRVLASIGAWRITEGALIRGIYKGLTVSGLVFISLASVRKDLRFPGRVGSALGETLFRFENLIEYRKKLDKSRFLASLDDLLFDQFDPAGPPPPASGAEAGVESVRSVKSAHYVLVMLFVGLNWAALLVDLISAR